MIDTLRNASCWFGRLESRASRQPEGFAASPSSYRLRRSNQRCFSVRGDCPNKSDGSDGLLATAARFRDEARRRSDLRGCGEEVRQLVRALRCNSSNRCPKRKSLFDANVCHIPTCLLKRRYTRFHEFTFLEHLEQPHWHDCVRSPIEKLREQPPGSAHPNQAVRTAVTLSIAVNAQDVTGVGRRSHRAWVQSSAGNAEGSADISQQCPGVHDRIRERRTEHRRGAPRWFLPHSRGEIPRGVRSESDGSLVGFPSGAELNGLSGEAHHLRAVRASAGLRTFLARTSPSPRQKKRRPEGRQFQVSNTSKVGRPATPPGLSSQC